MLPRGTVLHETYTIEGLLGQGGMGAVYEASHVRLPKKFAIKVLHVDAAHHEDAYARFRREAEIASRLGHPNIVEVVDFNVTPEGQPYIVMEKLEGQDLAAVLARQGALDMIHTLTVTRSIASALQAAHQAGVVHRDLKPQNVFLCTRGGQEVVKIVDFGISKITGAAGQTRSTDVLGTPGYMAPEQARGYNQQVDGRSDQFALATMIYEMVSGRHPFMAPDMPAMAVLYRVINEQPEPLTEVPPEFGKVVFKGLDKEPDGRYPDVASLYEALEEVCSRISTLDLKRAATNTPLRPLTPPQTSLSSRAGELQPRPGRRSTLRLALGAAAFVVVAGGISAWLILGRKPAPPPPPPVVVKAPEPPRPAKVTVRFALTPATAKATLDGKPLAGTSIELVRGSPAGQLHVEADGYDAANVVVQTDQDRIVEVRLVPHPAAPPTPDPKPKTRTPRKAAQPSDLENPFAH